MRLPRGMRSSVDLSGIFKAYDVRGRAPGELGQDEARAIGAAFARFSGAPRLAVGRDCRSTSPGLAEAFAAGATAMGADVDDLGEVTTDMVYLYSGAEDVPGAMITASHNPPEWNGIKFCLSGAKPVGADTGLEDIRHMAEAGLDPAGEPGRIERRHPHAAYVAHVLDIVGADTIGPVRVVVDGGNGMAGVAVPDVFDRIPAEMIGLYLEPDGTFPNHPADPLRPENLVDLLAEMKRTGADLGVAFDGDADRAFFVDDQLEPLSGSTTTAIIAKWFLEQVPGSTVVHNLICSRAVPETVRAAGGTPVRTRVGHSFIKQIMADTGAVFGGEHSGHYYFRDHYRADSGILAMLVLLRVLSEDGRPLSEVRGEFEPYAQSGEINLHVSGQAEAMTQVANAFGDGTADWTDGLTMEWSDRWFNLRPSNTEPVLRLNVEAPDRDAVATLVGRVSDIVEGVA